MVERGLKEEMPVSDLDGQTLDRSVCCIYIFRFQMQLNNFLWPIYKLLLSSFFHSTLLADSVNIFPRFLIALISFLLLLLLLLNNNFTSHAMVIKWLRKGDLREMILKCGFLKIAFNKEKTNERQFHTQLWIEWNLQLVDFWGRQWVGIHSSW